MSQETVQEVIIKAVSDPAFRELLFSDPDKALEGIELTEEEVESLKHIDRESFDDDSGELDERISRAISDISVFLGVYQNLIAEAQCSHLQEDIPDEAVEGARRSATLKEPPQKPLLTKPGD
jgi:hypothetical protein